MERSELKLHVGKTTVVVADRVERFLWLSPIPVFQVLLAATNGGNQHGCGGDTFFHFMLIYASTESYLQRTKKGDMPVIANIGTVSKATWGRQRSERRGGTHMGLPERAETILN